MKKVTLITLLLLNNVFNLFSQNAEAIYSITDGIIKGNIKWIESLYQDYDLNQYTYAELAQEKITINSDQFVISVGILKDYDDFGNGNFNVIHLYKNNKKIYELRLPDFWTLMYGGGSMMNYSSYTVNKHFITLASSKNSKTLAFIGWPYGGDLPLLTIIVVTEKDAKLVFNKHVRIDTIEKKDGVSEIKIQTLLEEYDSCGKLCVAPTYATMIAKDGILYWKE